AEDIEGDRAGGAKTLPMIIGVSKTGKLCLILALTGIIISLLPLIKFWGVYYLILIAVADAIILYAAAKGARAADSKALIDSKATTILKAGMFLATAFMLVSALLF
ncbi:MAG: UbiA family prenyltransferase, partial [Methanomicrobium sp.]|nr:UbiA family prenyltransferase [Methanomicrobium sp.]